MAKVTETTTTLFNKIFIPVITTVLGATAIYFLGFNKKGGGRTDIEAMLLTKETTVKAWRSFVTSQNIAYKNISSISEEYSTKIATATNTSNAAWLDALEDYETEIIRETQKTEKDLENILKEEDDIDKDFVSMLYRTLDNHKDQTKKAQIFFDQLKDIINSDLSRQEKQQRWMEEGQKFAIMGEKIEERSATEAESIAKVLAGKYNQAFNLDELLVYEEYKKKKTGANNSNNRQINKVEQEPGNDDNPASETALSKYLEGDWEMKDGLLQLDASGDMYWRFDGKGYTSGTWKIEDQVLRMDAINPDTKVKSLLVCSITNRKPDAFTLTILASAEMYEFRRAR